MKPNYMCLFLLGVFIRPVAGQGPISSGGPLSDLQSRYDAQFYNLSLKIDPFEKRLSGFVDVTLKSLSDDLRTIELDLIDAYTVDRVTWGDRSLEFVHDQHKLLVDLGQKLAREQQATVRIVYSGNPPEAKSPPWDGGFIWSKDSRGAPWVGVACQGEGAKIWWPCKDHPSDEPDSVALNITIPNTLVCAANGVFLGITPETKGWTTYHWKTSYPINPYCVSVNIADYAVRKRTYPGKQEMEIVFYVLKEDTAGADSLLVQAENMLAFYARHFGEYPFIEEKFGLAQTNYWGMEHQTINSYGNHYKNTTLGYDFLLFHEMGHEWWGNYLTVDDWADFWIHEGIDIYAEGMFVEERYGLEEYKTFFKKKVLPNISNKSPIVPGRNATTSEAYTRDIYYKGAYVVHMLRYLIGKEATFAILKEFLYRPKDRPHNHVVTADFMSLAQEMSGQDLGWFFQRYLFQADLPFLDYRVRKRVTGIELEINWREAGFPMPVEIFVRQNGKGEVRKLQVTGKKTTFNFPEGSEVIVDPEGWLLYERGYLPFFHSYVKYAPCILGITGLYLLVQ